MSGSSQYIFCQANTDSVPFQFYKTLNDEKCYKLNTVSNSSLN